MKNTDKKSGVGYALDSSLVMCSCAKQPPAGLDKLDTQCFEHYRILRATDENNGVFGKDSPFIRDMDCVPYVNMDNFSCCQADNYVQALGDIIGNLSKSMQQYSANSIQYTNLQNKREQYYGYLEVANQQKDWVKEKRGYTCVLELLDSWFHVDDKTLISNKMEIIARVKELQADYARQVNEMMMALRAGSLQYQREEGLAPLLFVSDAEQKKAYLEIIQQQQTEEKEPVNLTGEIEADREREKERQDRIKSQNADFTTQNIMLDKVNECLESCAQWIEKDIVTFKADEDNDTDRVYIDDIDITVEDVKKLQEKASDALKSVKEFGAIAGAFKITTEYEEVKALVEKIYSMFSELLSGINSMRSVIYERGTVTEDSFLVCRCGGIIRIVSNGNWMNVSRDRLVPNIQDLLRFSVKYLYSKQYQYCGKDQENSRISAFNILNGILMTFEDTGYDMIHSDESNIPVPKIEITVSPRSDALKQAKCEGAIKNAVSLLPGELEEAANVFGLIFAVEDVIESEEMPINSWESIGSFVYDTILKKYFNSNNFIGESVGKALSGYSKIAALFAILQDINYDTYAYFTGEIKIAVTTYCEEYIFIGTYNYYGEKEKEYTAQSSHKQVSVLNTENSEKAVIKYKIYKNGMFVKDKIEVSSLELQELNGKNKE